MFMEEDFADNAFVYASVQLLKIGEREDGWHTDGGASMRHAAVIVFGSRTLLVKLEDAGCISLPKRPGRGCISQRVEGLPRVRIQSHLQRRLQR